MSVAKVIEVSASSTTSFEDAINQGVFYGAAAELSGSTPIGNFTLSLGATTHGFWLLQFGLGRPLEESTILDAAF